MFQNVLMTTLTPLHAKTEENCWENRPFIAKWSEYKDDKLSKEEITKTIKKRSKRIRTSFTTEQLNQLEGTFHQHPYIDAKKRAELAKRTKVGERQIKIWFQNRRMKKKRQSFESSSDCESLNAASPPLVTSSTAEPSLLQQFIQEANNISEPQYQGSEIKNEGPYQQFPNYTGTDTFGYDLNAYQTEYYPNLTVNSAGYAYPDASNTQFQYYNNQDASWYGYDVNNFQNSDFAWQ